MIVTESRRESLTAVLGFAAIALVCAGALTVTYQITAPAIRENQQALLVANLTRVLDGEGASAETTPYRIVSAAEFPGAESEVRLFRATKKNGEPAEVAEISVLGYSGPIVLLVGFVADGTVTGVRVVSHRETPGLGDVIERDKSTWIEQFDGVNAQDLEDADWALIDDGGNFSGLTGASITPRAVIRAVEAVARFATKTTSVTVEQVNE